MNREQIFRIVNQKWFLPSATAVGGAIFGYTFGYRRTKSQYDQLQAEMTKMEIQTERMERLAEATARNLGAWHITPSETSGTWAPAPAHLKVDLSPLEDPGNIVDEEALKALKADHPSSRSKVIEPGTKIGTVTDIRQNSNGPVDQRRGTVVNVFGDGAGDEWDYKTEVEARTKEAPYIIHVDEYVADEMGWDSQSTLMWYDKDQILCDPHDTPIYNHVELVGELKFGHGSNDPNVVYVRNEKLQSEFEILRDEGSYTEIILGEQLEKEAEEEELKHSNTPKMRFVDFRSD